jgi:hypothetical protein
MKHIILPEYIFGLSSLLKVSVNLDTHCYILLGKHIISMGVHVSAGLFPYTFSVFEPETWNLELANLRTFFQTFDGLCF